MARKCVVGESWGINFMQITNCGLQIYHETGLARKLTKKLRTHSLYYTETREFPQKY